MVAPGTTLGAIGIGTAVSCHLFGLSTLQTFIYFKDNSSDSSVLKSLVATIYCLELAYTICVSHGFYLMSIQHRGHPIVREPGSLRVAGILGAIVDFLVQTFLANRVRRCFKTPYIAVICCLFAFLRFVFSIASSAVAIKLRPSLSPEWHWLLYVKWIVGVIADIATTTSLCYHLAKGRQRSKSRRIIRLIDRIMAIIIPTGLVTSVMAIAMLVCFLTSPDTLTYMAMATFEPNLFSNCFLALLNSREMLFDMDIEVQTSFLVPTVPHSITPVREIEVSLQCLSSYQKLRPDALA